MNLYDEPAESAPLTETTTEKILTGRAVSRGVAVGRAVCLHGRKRQFYRIELIGDAQISVEIERFAAAVDLAKKQLEKIGFKESKIAATSKSGIFAAHLLILEDESLLASVEENIRNHKVNAEWAVKTIFDAHVAEYKSFADAHLRERYIDLEDIADRILNALGGSDESVVSLGKDSIIVAADVKPSTLIELSASSPKGIVTEGGGWTSHTFILAREMNLPAVTGVGGVLRRVETGDEIIVDGYGGTIILAPTTKHSAEYEKIAAGRFHAPAAESSLVAAAEKLKTLDNREITIRANVDLPQGYDRAERLGARGIGLYRSEFLFNQFKGFPSESEQTTAYRSVAEMVGGAGVRIRTFDLGVEQLADENFEKEPNPALGLRGIRLSLSRPEQFRAQLRALLRASVGNEIDIVLPMISDASEIILTRKILLEEKERLEAAGISVGNPRLGAMIEVPSAIFTIDEIAAEADFLSLGTNDLVQYILGVDRDNESVADWFRSLHPAVIKAIKIVFDAAEKQDVPVLVCGEMAGSPVYAPLLIGLGATVFSMNVNSIERVRRVVAGIAFDEAAGICRLLEKCRTADETENLVKEFFTEKWSHLFSAETFEPYRK